MMRIVSKKKKHRHFRCLATIMFSLFIYSFIFVEKSRVLDHRRNFRGAGELTGGLQPLLPRPKNFDRPTFLGEDLFWGPNRPNFLMWTVFYAQIRPNLILASKKGPKLRIGPIILPQTTPNILGSCAYVLDALHCTLTADCTRS